MDFEREDGINGLEKRVACGRWWIAGTEGPQLMRKVLGEEWLVTFSDSDS